MNLIRTILLSLCIVTVTFAQSAKPPVSHPATSTTKDKPKGAVTAAIWPLNHKRSTVLVLTYPARHFIKTMRHVPPFGW